MDDVLKDPRRLQALARLADIGLTAAALVHEMRQPLVGISSFAQMIAADPVEARALAGEILTQTKVLETLLERTRGYAGVGPEEQRPMRADVAKSIEDALALFAGPLRKLRVEVRKTVAPDLPVVSLPPSSLQQILLNLIRNAAEAKTGGVVRILASSTSRQDGVVVRVLDEGAGVPPGFRARLFQPLATTKPDGVGLGLYVSQLIAEAAGGTLELEAGSGPGACFRLQLPCAPE